MSFEKFLKANLVKRQKPDFRQISFQLRRSARDLKTAEANLEIDPTWALTIAYHAMIRAGRALIFSKGFLPTSKNTHKTIVEITGILLGREYETLVSKFNRLRRKRHDFIYDSKNHTTHSEAESSLETGRQLIAKIVDLVKEEDPEKHLL